MMESLDCLQKRIYHERTNYRIEFSNVESGTVAIYFTSNNLFFPHTKEAFFSSVVEKDRFEWSRLKVNRARKHIFLRDIYKQWYASGINNNINTIDKLIDWLKVEVVGYSEIIVIGSSCGGYAATLVGTKLNASLIFNFNGQWNLYDNIVQEQEIISPILYEMEKNKDNGIKYFDIVNKDYDYNRVFYFVSVYSSCDKSQLLLLSKMKKIHIIKFLSNHHGIPFLKSTLPYILNMNFEELTLLSSNTHMPIFFDFKVSGLSVTFSFLLNAIKKKLNRIFRF